MNNMQFFYLYIIYNFFITCGISFSRKGKPLGSVSSIMLCCMPVRAEYFAVVKAVRLGVHNEDT